MKNLESKSRRKNRSSQTSTGQHRGESQHHSDSSVEQPENLRTEYREERTAVTAEKLEEPKLLFAGNDLDAFLVIDRAADKTGYVDSWMGDLLGRRLSVTGTIIVAGWAIDEEAKLPAKEVLLVRAGKILARSPLNMKRADVAAERFLEAYSTSGWIISISGLDLGLGKHQLEIFAVMQDQSSVVRLGSKTVKVCPLCHEDPARQVAAEKILSKRMLKESSSQRGSDSTQVKKWPKINIDEASIKDGHLVVRGWVISPAGISRIKVYVNVRFIGTCFYGELRSDVKRSYPYVNQSELSGFRLDTKVIGLKGQESLPLKIQVIDRTSCSFEFEKLLV